MFTTGFVSPDELLLDPRNPRLFVDESEFICSENDDYSLDWIQEKLMKKLETQPQHKLTELKHSIKSRGFEPFSDIYVRPYRELYLVFEGNRRTASIKSLLQDGKAGLSGDVKNSLMRVPVKILQCPEDEMDETIERILTTLHLNSSLQWQPMQQAFQFYQMYMGLVHGSSRSGTQGFEKNNYYIKKLSEQLGRERKDVVPELQVYCLYKQLRDSEYTIDGTMYSMLKEVTQKRQLATEYFEFDYESFKISDLGMEHLYSICLHSDRPISEPRQVRFLYLCHSLGRTDLLDRLANHDVDIDEVKVEVEGAKDDAAFLQGLSKAERALSRLVLQKPNAEEAELIEKIIRHSTNLTSLLSLRAM